MKTEIFHKNWSEIFGNFLEKCEIFQAHNTRSRSQEPKRFKSPPHFFSRRWSATAAAAAKSLRFIMHECMHMHAFAGAPSLDYKAILFTFYLSTVFWKLRLWLLGFGLDLGLRFYWNLSRTIAKTSAVSLCEFSQKATTRKYNDHGAYARG